MTRTYIITGAGSGIGKATAERLRSAGHRVIGVDLSGSDIDGDLSTPEGRLQAANAAHEAANGHVDAVIASAGLSVPNSLTVAVNYFGVVEFVEALRPALVASDNPRVAVVSSFSSLQPNVPELVDAMLAGDETAARTIGDQLAAVSPEAGGANYTSSKRAISRWVRRVAPTAEWAGEGIAINAVGPGIVVTPMTAPLLEAQGEMLERMLPMPLNGHMPPEAVASLLDWLTSAENTHTTGQTIYIDGGSEALQRGDDIWSALPPIGV